MPVFLMQLQMLLSALTTVLQHSPLGEKPRAREALDLVASALSAGAAAAEDVHQVSDRLRDLRQEVERLAQRPSPVSPEELESALAQVRAASAGFRAAVQARG